MMQLHLGMNKCAFASRCYLQAWNHRIIKVGKDL